MNKSYNSIDINDDDKINRTLDSQRSLNQDEENQKTNIHSI